MASTENTQKMKPRRTTTSRSTILAHAAALSFSAVLLVMILFFSTFSFSFREYDHQLLGPVCDEIYVVAEGETLHTISDKCGDPFIIEQNPHIQDPDDVFPGLIIKITPATASSTV